MNENAQPHPMTSICATLLFSVGLSLFARMGMGDEGWKRKEGGGQEEGCVTLPLRRIVALESVFCAHLF